MLLNIKFIKLNSSRSFTLIEMIASSLVAMYVMMAAYSVYIMAWRWYYETAPLIESQRVARIVLQTVAEGMIDSTAGQDSVSGTTYRRRSGIAFATLTNQNPAPATPVLSDANRKINFRLEQDTANSREYYIGADGLGHKSLYYRDSSLVARKVPGTEINTAYGDLVLTFASVAGFSNLYKITVHVDRTVYGVRKEPYAIEVEYSDHIFLRNI